MEKWSGNRGKWLLWVHLLFSAIMLGGAVAFLILSLTAATTRDESVIKGCYTAMNTLAKTSVRYSTIAALLTGILLSVTTRWGLFRFYWIIAKEALTIVSIVLGPIGMYVWTLKAVNLTHAEGLQALHEPAFIANSGKLWTGIILQILSIAAMYALSVFKPWGQRKRKDRPNVA